MGSGRIWSILKWTQRIVNLWPSAKCKICILRAEVWVFIKNGIISHPHQSLQNLTINNCRQWPPVAVRIVPKMEPWVITEFSAVYVALDWSRCVLKKSRTNTLPESLPLNTYLDCTSKNNSVNQTVCCSQCKSVQYCSKDCQRASWKVHKKVCKEMKADAAVAYYVRYFPE